MLILACVLGGIVIGWLLLHIEWFMLYYMYCIGIVIYLARCIYQYEIKPDAYCILVGFAGLLFMIGRTKQEDSCGGGSSSDYEGGSGCRPDQSYWEDSRDSSRRDD